jgi:hypothetical protein
MKLHPKGGCLCGAFRYGITEAVILVDTCHCTDCQRIRSAAFATGMVMAAEAIHFRVNPYR